MILRSRVGVFLRGGFGVFLLGGFGVPLRSRVGFRRGFGQSGMSLIEVMLSVMLAAIIMIPLLAWGSMMLKAQPTTQDQLMRTVRSGLISFYLPADISGASAADDFSGATAPSSEDWWNDWSRSDCVGGPGGNGRKVVVMLTGGVTQLKTVYSVAKSSEDPTEWSIWRRQCDAIDGAVTSESKELFARVEPALARTFAACFSPAGQLPCRQVELSITPKGQKKPVVISAMRRTDSEARLYVSDGSAGGNHVPSARIQVLSTTPTGNGQEVEVVLDASASSDPGGSIVNYAWELPDAPVDESPTITSISGPNGLQQTIRLPRAGVYAVELTVTDNGGASTTTYKRISVENRVPIAMASVSPLSGRRGVDPFTFSSAGTSDPDGTIASGSCWWEVTGFKGDTETETILLWGTTASGVILPADWKPGPVSVVFTAVDDNGAKDSFVTSLTLTAEGETTTTTLPVDPGGSTTTVPSSSTTSSLPPTSSTTTTAPVGSTTTTIAPSSTSTSVPPGGG